MVGEGAVLVDGVGDRGVDAARVEFARIRGPDVKVLAAVAGRGVHEAGAGVVGDVVAGQQRHGEFVAAADAFQRMGAFDGIERVGRQIAHLLVGRDARLLEHASASASARISRSPFFAQLSAGASVTSKRP